MAASNYEKMKREMQGHFLDFDQETMIRRFGLEHDAEYLYITFVKRPYRICRNTGRVEWSDDGFACVHEADYNEAMTIFDVLCCSKEGCRLSGEFVAVNNLPGIVAGARSGDGLFGEFAKVFDADVEGLRAACERLGGVSVGKADVGCQLELFDFLPVRLNFWASDDEFSAELRFMWDRNLLEFMHYETSYFAMFHLLGRIRALMRKAD